MYIANFSLHGEITKDIGLSEFLITNTGIDGGRVEASKILIWINSPGGDLLPILDSINLIKMSPIPVVTVISGSAESAALLLAVAGHERYAMDNSFGMAHHFSTEMGGSYHEFKDTAKLNDILDKGMERIFLEHTKLSTKKIREICLGRATTFFTAKEMLEHGMVDEVLAPGKEAREKLLGGLGGAKKTNDEDEEDL